MNTHSFLALKRNHIHARAKEIATLYYYKRGYIPSLLVSIIEQTRSGNDFIKHNPDQPRVPAGNGRTSGQWTDGGFNADQAAKYLSKRTVGRKSDGSCASYVRDALNRGGGLNVQPPEKSIAAKDYGSSLEAAGFDPIASNEQRLDNTGSYPPPNYEPKIGDVVIIQPATGRPYGHMQMYNGRIWISDFWQNGFWPGRGYRAEEPTFVIYRYSPH